ncbi:Uncharacterised protein [Vibrio cholerae]|nr:Uncharacterised protein [Vibrio cholerae]CSB35100.1 Uncharacterised protein [Vibrio cholerae]
MQRRYAVHRIRADHTQVGHAHHAVEAFFDDRELLLFRHITRPFGTHLLQETVVDLVNDLHVTWQQALDQRLTPRFQCFWQQSVVGVSKSVRTDRPRRFPRHQLLIDQNAHQLRNRDGWVRIVKLNGFVFRQIRQRVPCRLVATQNIAHRRCTVEILLHQTQGFAFFVVVIRIQDFGDVACIDQRVLRFKVVTVIEAF